MNLKHRISSIPSEDGFNNAANEAVFQKAGERLTAKFGFTDAEAVEFLQELWSAVESELTD